MGTNSDDLDVMGRATDYVVGRNTSAGGSGDSAPMTALGVFQGMRAAAQAKWGTPSLAGRTVGVEGTGKVGYQLIKLLLADGASVVATDVNAAALDRVARDFPRSRSRPPSSTRNSTSTHPARWAPRSPTSPSPRSPPR